MVKWRLFPANLKATQDIMDIIDVFSKANNQITSDMYNLSIDEVLAKVAPLLQSLMYKVEIGKTRADKIRVPVLFGENGQESLSFEADAYSENKKFVVEVEAGCAVVNYQFLKDFFQACMMTDVEYLCIAVRQKYLKKMTIQMYASLLMLCTLVKELSYH